MTRARHAGIALAFAIPLIGILLYLIAYVRAPAVVPVDRPPTSVRHVLLITIDTLRADRLGSYGYSSARTPTLDALARRGTRFSRAYATAPVTLPSHASMMTGLYPPRHGARHNGIAMRRDVPALAEAFQRTGFETGAFVSAFPLDARFGLTRGFDVYDSELPRGDDGRRGTERPGPVTVDRAIAWMRGRPQSARIFVWVHLFEPHAPYGTPAESERLTASSRYDEEIAIVDREIGRLLDAWPDLSSTLVVSVADHGEAFGEHGEIGHSIFVYDTTLRVPMILAGPGMPEGTVVDQPVTVADLAPTVAALSQLPPFAGDGIDLLPLIAGRASNSRALYAESFAPLVDFGWAALRSLRRDGVKLIAAPRPELYDVEADAGERRNMIGARAAVARELSAAIDRISGPELAPTARIDPDARARLRSLGYASSAASSSGPRVDPKDRIAVAARIASVTSGELQGAAAERALREVLGEDPQNPQARQRLGFVLAESGRCAEAEKHFAAAIATRLPSADPYLGLAMCQAQRGATAQSLATLRDARQVEPGNPIVEANIGLTALQVGRLDEASGALAEAVKIDPDLHEARFALVRALARQGHREAALKQATELLRRLPPGAPQRAEVERLVSALR